MAAEQPARQLLRRGFETNLSYIRVFYIKFCEFFRKVPKYQ